MTVEESTALVKQLGEEAIQQKALDTAVQIALYLEAHPALLTDPAMLTDDAQLAQIAVQPVGKTGYTALYNDKGIVFHHINPALIGQDMHMFAESLPEFWAIFEVSLDGTKVGSYYVWQEPDESLRDKYMECVPVEGTDLRVAATTYIDEFYAPLRETEQKAEQIFLQARTQAIAALVFVSALALFGGWWLSSIISKPITALVSASQAVESGCFEDVNLKNVEKRSDEMGGLARTFSSMADQVYERERERNLKEEVIDLQMKVRVFIEVAERYQSAARRGDSINSLHVDICPIRNPRGWRPGNKGKAIGLGHGHQLTLNQRA